MRTFGAAFLNEVANHPEVRPWLGGEGEIDLTPMISNVDNFAFVTDGGGFVCEMIAPGVYEAHSMFLPDHVAIGPFLADSMRYMFTATQCIELVTKVPDGNNAALGLARQGGFSKIFQRPGAAYMSLSFDKWKERENRLLETGEWFHAQLEAAKIKAGSQLPVHEDDPAHDRAVGAAVEMMRYGNTAKAIFLYNKWARFAGYVPIRLLSETPVVVDVIDAVVEVRKGEMEILTCR